MSRIRVTFAALVAALGFVTAVAAADKPATIVRWTQTELKWEPVPDTPVMVSRAWTNANGSYCQFNKFPKGTKIPLHTHTADVTSVVVAGQFGFAETGTVMKLVGPGTYQSIPGGLKHTTECGTDGDCVIFSCGPAPFDLVPVAIK